MQIINNTYDIELRYNDEQSKRITKGAITDINKQFIADNGTHFLFIRTGSSTEYKINTKDVTSPAFADVDALINTIFAYNHV